MNSLEYYEELRQREEKRKEMRQEALNKIAESIANQKKSDAMQKEFEHHRNLQNGRFQ